MLQMAVLVDSDNMKEQTRNGSCPINITNALISSSLFLSRLTKVVLVVSSDVLAAECCGRRVHLGGT